MVSSSDTTQSDSQQFISLEAEGCSIIYEFTDPNQVTRKVTSNDGWEHITTLTLTGDQDTSTPRRAFDQGFLQGNPRSFCDDISYGVSQTVRVADLFCGAGGLSLGVREACEAVGVDFQSVLSVDKDSASLGVYSTNFSPTVEEQEVWECIDGEFGEVPTDAELQLLNRIGDTNILLAGPPCQGHSNLNNHTRRSDERNRLYRRVGRFAEIADPEFIITENVPAVVHGEDESLDQTYAHLSQNLGYEVDTGIVDLVRLGVPQKRRRHVLVAARNEKYKLSEIAERHSIKTTRGVLWAIGDLAGRQNGATAFDRPPKHSKANTERIKYLQNHGEFDLPDRLRPKCHRDSTHRYKSMYGRMKPDEPSQTITGGYGSPGQGRFIHPTQPRALTPHEAARLQFFPDTFDFSATSKKTDLSSMIGNAVPAKLSFALSMEFLTRW